MAGMNVRSNGEKEGRKQREAFSVEKLYEKYYAGEGARRGLFDALAAWSRPGRVLYPGSFIHITASFVFPSVVYVDNNRDARRFFAKMDDVAAFANRHRVYSEKPELIFHGLSYEAGIPESENAFDLLISLYAGFISKPCKRYLKIGGILAVNNSHGDAGLASINPDYEFIGVIQKRGDRLRVVEENLDSYFKPKRETRVTEELVRKLNRGIGYTKTAPAYLFRRKR